MSNSVTLIFLCFNLVIICVSNFFSMCVNFVSVEVTLEFGQPLFFAIEGEPVVFLTVKKLGISYIDIPFTLSTQSATATG